MLKAVYEMTLKSLLIPAVAAAALLHTSSQAVTSYNQNVTGNWINGSGNINGAFTVDRSNGIELGLRAKVRYDLVNNQPQNVFNSGGDGTYSMPVGAPPSNLDRARWNFEWSINTDYDSSNPTGLKLDDLRYEIGIDYDPSAAYNPEIFDPINGVNPDLGVIGWDHSIGNNSTTAANDSSSVIPAIYANLIAGNNLAQNSWNLAFYDNPPPFNPNVGGIYTITLKAFDSNNVLLASTSIDVHVPDAGASFALMGLGAAALLGLRKKLA